VRRAPLRYHGFEHAGRADALEADATPIGTVFVFGDRAERDAWVDFPSWRADGSLPMRKRLGSREARDLMSRRLPVVDFTQRDEGDET
jgi:hypothetical protein